MVVIFAFSHADTLPTDRHLRDSISRFSDLCAKQGGTFILPYSCRFLINSQAFTSWIKILRISAFKSCKKSLHSTQRTIIGSTIDEQRKCSMRNNSSEIFLLGWRNFYNRESEHRATKLAQTKRPTGRQKTQSSCTSSAKNSCLHALWTSRDPQFIGASIGQTEDLFPQSRQRSWVKIRVIFCLGWGAKSAQSPLNLMR